MKCDKNIPLPKSGRKPKYRFDEIPVGESKWYAGTIFTVSGAAGAYARRHEGFAFQCRTEVKDDKKGVRVWRVTSELKH